MELTWLIWFMLGILVMWQYLNLFVFYCHENTSMFIHSLEKSCTTLVVIWIALGLVIFGIYVGEM